MKRTEVQKGQILAILALAMVVLLGFTAVAVDGSRVYNERRQDQATADSTALSYAYQIAKAGFTCPVSGVPSISPVTTTTGTTTVTTTYPSCTSSPTTLNIHTVVASTVNTYFLKAVTNKPTSTTVDATAKVTLGGGTYAGGNAIYTTGTSCSEWSTPYGGIFVSGGTTKIQITDGGIFSASCLSATGDARILAYGGLIQYTGHGSTTFYAGKASETPQIEYTTGTGLFMTNTDNFILNQPSTTTETIASALTQPYQFNNQTNTANTNISKDLWPVPVTSGPTVPTMEPMTTPTCPKNADGTLVSTSLPNQVTGINDYTVSPGTFSGDVSWNAWSNPPHTLTFSPGTYCFPGSLTLNGTATMNNTVFYFTGGSGSNYKGISYGGGSSNVYTENNSTIYLTNGDFNLASGVPLNADNITIYIYRGKFSISGAASGVMSAPDCDTSACGVPPAIKGVLVYMAADNPGDVSITASGSASLIGTIYAPISRFSATGNTLADAMNVQIIAKMVDVTGSSTITMNKSKGTFYGTGGTTSIDLLK